MRYKVFIALSILLIIFGCKNSTSSSESKVRWKKVELSGEETACAVHVRSDSTEMYIVTEEKFMKFVQGVDEPVLVKELEHSFMPEQYQLLLAPYICDDYYFFGLPTGERIYVGNTQTGEELGYLNVLSFIDSTFYSTKFAKSEYFFNSPYIKADKYGKFMLSLIYNDINLNSHRKWYYGSINTSDSVAFIVEKSFDGCPPNAERAGAYISFNGFFNDKYWQYSSRLQMPSIIILDVFKEQFEYVTIFPTMYHIYNYEDTILGSFNARLKKSFDGGYTWEDWISLNADWRTDWINGVLVLHLSHNYASINIETEEVVNYEKGELEHNNIIHMAEFDNKVFALTENGVFYSTFEDCFKPKSNSRTNSREDTEIDENCNLFLTNN